MRRRFWLAWVFVLGMCLFLSACSAAGPDKDYIINDLESYHDGLNDPPETVDHVEILKRRTVKGIKTVWCKVDTSNSVASFEKYLVLRYSLYDDAEWLLLGVSESDPERWKTVPSRQGVSTDEK